MLPSNNESDTSVEFLQTDAAINGGNSGGPMFDMAGSVIGIVSTIMSHSGRSEGLAFATAANTAKQLLMERKPFWSGIDGLVVTSTLAKALNLPQAAGVLVQRIGDVGSRGFTNIFEKSRTIISLVHNKSVLLIRNREFSLVYSKSAVIDMLHPRGKALAY